MAVQNNLSHCINAMRSQEEETAACQNYLNHLVDASCRKAMVDWFVTVAEAFHLSRETVWIATSILDRYLSSGKSKSSEALRSKQIFQSAAITSFYMAVKIFEPVQLGIGMVIKICRGHYKETDIFAMERDILFSLEWRVCVSAATPMEYVRQFLAILPDWTDVAEAVQEHAAKYADRASKDVYFSTCRTSTVGAACLTGALNDLRDLSSFEKKVLLRQLNGRLDFELESIETRKVERRLLSQFACCESRMQSHAIIPCSRVNPVYGQPLSPVSVVQGL